MYFPDADTEPEEDPSEATDVAWLACAIASLDVDVLAVQEFKRTKRALEKRGELITLLNERTSGDWQLRLAECQPDDVQHPGFLYDASRVTGGHFRQIDAIHPEPVCDNRKSPAFGGYFSIANGPDFHLIVLHLDAYPEKRSLEGRMYSSSKLGELAEQAYGIVPDRDVVYTGDFNTTGCDECEPALSSQEEIAQLRDTLAHLQTPLTLLEADLTCSKPGGSLLDHFVVMPGMAELPAGARAQVLGSCAEAGCERLREWHQESTERLSDHCPLLLELTALDDD